MKNTIIFFFILVGLQACSKSVPDLVVLPKQVPTTIAVSIQDVGGFQEAKKVRILARVRQNLLHTKLGQPVMENHPAQLLLVVKIIDWPVGTPKEFSWKLVDNKGHILTSGLERDNNASNGFSLKKVAKIVVNGVAVVDTKRFTSDEPVLYAENIAKKEAKKEITKTKVDRSYPKSKNLGENSFAIIVGVENYRDEIQPALYATNDALNIGALFSKTLNIPEKNVKLLLNNRASKTDILIALTDWLAKQKTEDANLFFYFSGHGSPKVDSGDAYILPYDANPTYIKSAGISVEEVQSLLKRANSKNTYIILDSCFSGNGGRSILAKGTRPMVPIKAIESRDTILFSASGTNQTTGIHSEAKNGLFTYHFIRGLSGDADEDKDAKVSVLELERYVYTHVRKAAKQQNREQDPSLIAPEKAPVEALNWVEGLEN